MITGVPCTPAKIFVPAQHRCCHGKSPSHFAASKLSCVSSHTQKPGGPSSARGFMLAEHTTWRSAPPADATNCDALLPTAAYARVCKQENPTFPRLLSLDAATTVCSSPAAIAPPPPLGLQAVTGSRPSKRLRGGTCCAGVSCCNVLDVDCCSSFVMQPQLVTAPYQPAAVACQVVDRSKKRTEPAILCCKSACGRDRCAGTPHLCSCPWCISQCIQAHCMWLSCCLCILRHAAPCCKGGSSLKPCPAAGRRQAKAGFAMAAARNNWHAAAAEGHGNLHNGWTGATFCQRL